VPSVETPSVVVLAATRDEAVGAGLRIAGLTVAERAIRQLAQAEGTCVIVAGDGSVALPDRLPANVELRTVPDPPAAQALARGLGAPLVGADVVRLDRRRLDGGLRITDETTRRGAEDAVFAALFRPDLGFIARRLNKPLSVRFTRHVLVHTPVTPNQITLFAAALGILGCVFIASGGYWLMVLGFLCQQLQSMLDGCDGELARVRFQQSKFGAWLDTFVDDVLNVLITGAVGVGMWRAGAGTWALTVGLAGAAMLVVSNLVIMRDMRRQKASGDLMDMVWWFSGGRKLAELPAGDGRPGLGTMLFQLGRRDTALLLWLLFALVGQVVLVMVMATIIALSWFVASVAQLVIAPAAPAR
jgi:phosphatidylglycerophosphate synthase